MIIFIILSIITLIFNIISFQYLNIPSNKEYSDLKELSKYSLIILLHIILSITSIIIYLFNTKLLDNYNYTNSPINIIIGLTIYTISTNIFCLLSIKTILKLINSKFKYLIFILYLTINYTTSVIAYCMFGQLLGKFIIDNIFLNLFRWIVIYHSILIFPIYILKEKTRTS